MADNAYGVFVNSDNDTADFENSNETAHKHNGTRDDDSGKAYWGDGWAAFFNKLCHSHCQNHLNERTIDDFEFLLYFNKS